MLSTSGKSCVESETATAQNFHFSICNNNTKLFASFKHYSHKSQLRRTGVGRIPNIPRIACLPRRVATSSYRGHVDEWAIELSLLPHHVHGIKQALDRPEAAAVDRLISQKRAVNILV